MLGPSTLRVAVLCVLAGFVLAASPALAAERPKLPRVAVLDIKATGAIDSKSVAALSAMIASEAARYPLKTFAGSDLQSLMGFEKQKQLMGCSDGSCLAEVGGALGVDYLLASEVGEFGGRWLLTVSLLDTKKAVALQRSTRTAQGQGGLVDQVSAAVHDVVMAIPSVLATRGTAAEVKPVLPEPTAEASGQKPPVAAAAPAQAVRTDAEPGASRRTAGWALVGAGGALVAGGAVAGILALVDAQDAQAHAPTTLDQLRAVRGKVEAEAWAADVLCGVGAAAAVAGLVVALTAPSAADARPVATVGFGPIAGGGALVVSGGF
ncbi:MAG: hypothetical protein QM765_22430 [Myxococcales bacterium]